MTEKPPEPEIEVPPRPDFEPAVLPAMPLGKLTPYKRKWRRELRLYGVALILWLHAPLCIRFRGPRKCLSTGGEVIRYFRTFEEAREALERQFDSALHRNASICAIDGRGLFHLRPSQPSLFMDDDEDEDDDADQEDTAQ